MRILLLAPLLLAALAGCVSDESTQEAAPVMGGISYHECRDTGAAVPTPMENAMADMPEGFAPIPFPNTQGELAIMVALAFECNDTTYNGVSLGPVREFHGILPVTPPESFIVEGVEAYAIVFGSFESNADIEAIWNSWGWDEVYTLANTTIDVTHTPAVHTATAIGGDANVTVETMASVIGVPSEIPGNTMHIFGAHNQTLLGGVALSWGNSTVGGEGPGMLVVDQRGAGFFPPVLGLPGFGFLAWDYDAMAVPLALPAGSEPAHGHPTGTAFRHIKA